MTRTRSGPARASSRGRRRPKVALTAGAVGALAVSALLAVPALQVGSGASAASDPGLHVVGRHLVDGNGEQVVFRGVEHVVRWGDYSGNVPWGDMPWEGAANDTKGDQITEIARTGANSVRIVGGKPSELEGILRKAVVDNKMWVSIARVNWRDPATIAAVKKYEKFVTLHVKGETETTDESVWRNEAVRDITEARKLGYTSPIEIYSTSYGQRLSPILNQGAAIAAADPLKKVVFGYQLYSELAKDVKGALDATAGFGYPVTVGSSRFDDGIKNGWGNTPDTYKQVWDGTASRQLSSFYWIWGINGAEAEKLNDVMTSTGRADGLTAVGRYLVDESQRSLRTYAPKTRYLIDGGPSQGPDEGQEPPAGPTGDGTSGGPTVQVSPTQSWKSVTQSPAVVTGTRYRAAIKVKGSGSVQLRVHDGIWGDDLGSVTCSATTTWTPCSFTVTTRAEDRVTFRITDSTAGGAVTVDDASLTPVAGGGNVLSSGGFESTADWGVEAPFSIR